MAVFNLDKNIGFFNILKFKSDVYCVSTDPTETLKAYLELKK